MLVTFSEYEADEHARAVGGMYCITKESTYTDTWQGFCDSLVHEPGPKHGTCFVPVTFDWSKTDDGRLRRQNVNVLGACAMVAIDSDGLTDDQARRVWSYIITQQLSAIAYSTHSYGSKPGCRMRLFVRLHRPQTADEIPLVRRGLGELLGAVLGVPWSHVVDSKALDKARMFFGPRHAPERASSAFVWRTSGPVLLDVDLLVEMAPPALEEVVVTDSKVQGHPDQLAAAQAGLDRLCDNIIDCDSGLYKYAGQATYHYGRYIAAGLLNERSVLNQIFSALDEQRSRHGDNTETPQGRREQVRTGIRQGIARGPLWPLNGSVADDGALVQRPSYSGRRELENRLELQTPDLRYPAETAQRMMERFLRQGRAIGTPWVGVVRVPPGVGKSYSNQQLAVERANQGLDTLILAPRHDLCRQIVQNLKKLGHEAFHMYSSTQPTEKTGGYQCLRIDEPLIQSLLKRGVSVPATECPTCPLKDECHAKGNGTREPGPGQRIIVAPFASATKAITLFEGDFEIICDEEPEPNTVVEYTVEQLEKLLKSGVWGLLKNYQADAISELIRARLQGTQPSEYAMEKALASHGQLHLKGYSAVEDQRWGADLEQLRGVLHSAQNWGAAQCRNGVWRTSVEAPVWGVLRESGGFVMSATITPELYKNLSVRKLELPVADHHTTVRIMAYTAHSSRSQVMPGGHVDWKLVARDLQEAFRLTKECKRILIITFKRISDALRTTHKHLINHHHTEAIHYEKALGMNAWEGWDAIVSMYDARTPPNELNGELDWSMSNGNARRMATQAHGRTRDAQPRTHPAMHVVIGKEPPEDWGQDNCLVVYRHMGRPPGLMEQDIMDALIELRAQLGMKAAAKRLEVPYSTLAAWLAGTRTPSADKLETLRKLLPGPGALV